MVLLKFKGIFKQFCENPMGKIEQHPVLKTAFNNAQKFFGFLKKGQEIRAIEWILFTHRQDPIKGQLLWNDSTEH